MIIKAVRNNSSDRKVKTRLCDVEYDELHDNAELVFKVGRVCERVSYGEFKRQVDAIIGSAGGEKKLESFRD